MFSEPYKSNVSIHFQQVAETYPQKYYTEPEPKDLTVSVANHFFSHEQNLMN